MSVGYPPCFDYQVFDIIHTSPQSHVQPWTPPLRHFRHRIIHTGRLRRSICHVRAALSAHLNPPVSQDEPIDTVTMYRKDGDILLVGLDATQHDVGIGENANYLLPSETDIGPKRRNSTEWRSWRPLRFRECRNRSLGRGVSHVAQDGYDEHLYSSNPDRWWTEYMIPRVHHCQEPGRHINGGGLVGELSILIGLMALLIPPGNDDRLANHIQGVNWEMPHGGEYDSYKTWNGADHFVFEVEPHSDRGVIVKVWAAHNPEHCCNSGVDTIEAYGRGDYGKIFD